MSAPKEVLCYVKVPNILLYNMVTSYIENKYFVDKKSSPPVLPENYNSETALRIDGKEGKIFNYWRTTLYDRMYKSIKVISVEQFFMLERMK